MFNPDPESSFASIDGLSKMVRLYRLLLKFISPLLTPLLQGKMERRMMKSPEDIKLKKQFFDLAYSGLEILILYLHIANKPETPPSLRNYFNDIVKTI